MDSSERETFQAAILGDREAFEMIIRTQSRALFAIAYGVLQNREEAEDVVQDTLMKAWKTRSRVRDPEKFPAWLGTIARHCAHDCARRRRPLRLEEPPNETVEPEIEQSSDAARERTISAQVHTALGSLPELHRMAVTLRYFEEMDYASIENTLGLSNGALRGILGRAMVTMRRRLRPALARLEEHHA
jgi:RNA polymerase sigma-70 factor (ECF subfamily)